MSQHNARGAGPASQCEAECRVELEKGFNFRAGKASGKLKKKISMETCGWQTPSGQWQQRWQVLSSRDGGEVAKREA
ncbi:hypothetical protein NDU88_005524 [Pleurodeles waltl]|uniref:Uncharacterized protein n=1 Tax=Pleurodeles waltl TaxID=8319 RepID=A0AAV7PJ49_PLEWA|nr:hypothetical protein NDU88_005524 [Pleurodeles waltl]